MNFIQYISVYKNKIDKLIEIICNEKLNEIDNSFLKSFYLEIKNYILCGGKRIRPILTIATFNAFADETNENILYVSVAIELLHNMTLIIDDYVDKHNFRRGSPTFLYKFQQYYVQHGFKNLLINDYKNIINIFASYTTFYIGLELFNLNSFNYKLNNEAIRYYVQCVGEMIKGALIEYDMSNQNEVSIQEYFKMVSLKTGSLIEKSMLIGATYANVTKEHKALLSDYSINIGIIFQLIDDILGTFGDKKKTGKAINSDIKENRCTCLLIITRNELNNKKRKYLDRLIKKINKTDLDIQEIKGLYKEANAIKLCEDLINKYYQKAKLTINKLRNVINRSEIEFFESLLEFIIKRNF